VFLEGSGFKWFGAIDKKNGVKAIMAVGGEAEPFFSIIIPAYNAESFICDALDSVVSQTFTDYEIIVVDDGSTDKTYDKALFWSRQRPATKIKIVQQTNKGIGGARNTAIGKAQGVFIAFLDADDLWLEQKLAVVARYIEDNSSVDLICHDVWFQANNVDKKRIDFGPHAIYRDLLFKGNSISPSATTVRRQNVLNVGCFSEDMRFNSAEDYDLWLRLARAGSRVGYLHEVLSVYRSCGQGISSNASMHNANTINVFEAHFQKWQPKNLCYRYLARRRRGIILRSGGHVLCKQGRHAEARRYLYAALRQDPFNWKIWVIVLLNICRLKK